MKSTDFLKEHNAFIAQDADEMHRDQEVQMARADLYNAADYAIKLHKILRGVNDTANMEQWVLEKIAIANENLRTVYEYLNYEAQEQEGAMPEFAFESADQQFEALVNEGYSMADVQRDAQANARKTIDAATAPKEKTPFMAQVSKKIIGGVAGAVTGGVKGAYKGFTGQANEGYDPVESDYQQWEDILVKDGHRGDPSGAYALELVVGHQLMSDPAEVASTIRNILTYVKQNRQVLGNAVSDRTTVKDAIIDIKNKFPQQYQAASQPQGVAEGVAETVPMSDAVKVLKQYGAEHFKTTSNELHFYKNGKGFSVDLVMNPDATRSATLTSLNSAARSLKGQGVAESCDAGATGASSFATGPVGEAAPMQRRVKSESAKKNYGNANKVKQPKFGKGVY